MKKLSLIVLLTVMAVAGTAFAATLAGVTLPDSAVVDGETLVLNGIGLRTKTWLKVKIYVGGLYLPQKTDTVQAIMAQTGPDRILMHMIYAASKSQFADAWNEGFTDNNPGVNAVLQSEIAQFIAYFGDAKRDDSITLDYIPGQGTQLSWNSTVKGNIPGEEFHKALLNVFLGPKPPTEELKKGLLGQNS